ncbi:MAG: cache domain-containing protein [bacterium]
MKTKRIQSLSFRIITYIVFFFTLFGAIFIFFYYITIRQTLLSEQKKLSEVYADHYVTNIYELFDNPHQELAGIAQNLQIIDFIQAPQKDQESNISEILKYSNNLKLFDVINILDQKGIAIASSNSKNLGIDYSFRPYFQESIQGKASIYGAIGMTSNVYSYYIAIPIYQNEKIIGIISGSMNADQFQNYLLKEAAARNNQIMFKILDDYGVIVHSCDPSEVFSSVAPLSPETLAIFKKEQRYSNQSLNSIGLVPDFSFLQNQYLDQTYFLNQITSQGSNKILFNINQIPNTRYYLVLETDITQNIQSIDFSVMRQGLMILGMLFCMSILLGIIISKTLEPLRKITFIANRIASGHYELQADETIDNEIGTLAGAFNKMINKLLVLRENEEQKVLFQTQKLNNKVLQLEKLNRAMIGRELKMLDLKQRLYKFENQDKNAE